jgi:hypothetical protein
MRPSLWADILPRIAIRAGDAQFAIFAAQRCLQRQILGNRAAIRQDHLPALLLDSRGCIGQRDGLEHAAIVELEKFGFSVEIVERPFGRNLPVGFARLPAIFGAQHAFALVDRPG